MKHRRYILLPFSWIYAAVIWFRNVCYDKGIFGVEDVNVPVISVGNITTGGTGKTPFVEYLIRYLKQHGKKVAVVSRGYKRDTKGTFIASDGYKIFGSASNTGDEVYQMARKFPFAIVVADELRVRGARVAVDSYGADVIVLDDGFQHRSLGRNLDVVMIDGETLLDDIPMLPAGNRREPLSALRRANILVISRSGETQVGNKGTCEYGAAPVARVEFRPKSFIRYSSFQSISYSQFKNKTCVAFCGIGNPRSFRRGLEKLELNVLELITYPDHHSFGSVDLKSIEDSFIKHQPAVVVTTEKDAMRLINNDISGYLFSSLLHYLEIEAEVVEGEMLLHQFIDSTIRRA